MLLCSACKSKTSDERCLYRAMNGILFCKRHSKVKNPRMWNEVNNVNSKVICIQKVWKGYHIRHLLKLAGPGVLNRNICSNTEELFTLDDSKTVHPMNYFAFEENGKNYWFDVKSILQYLDTTDELTNPYTRQPFATEAKKRLHQLHIYRLRRKLPILHTEPPIRSVDEILDNRFRHVSHILQSNDFFGIKPDTFIALGPVNINFYILSLIEGFSDWALEHADKPSSSRHKYSLYVRNLPLKFQNVSYKQYLYVLSSVLLFILNDCREPFQPCFIIMSGLHRI